MARASAGIVYMDGITAVTRPYSPAVGAVPGPVAAGGPAPRRADRTLGADLVRHGRDADAVPLARGGRRGSDRGHLRAGQDGPGETELTEPAVDHAHAVDTREDHPREGRRVGQNRV